MNHDRYIFDSYALLCFFKNEPGAEQVEHLLKAAENKKIEIFLSTINLAEIYYIIHREYGGNEALENILLITNMPINIIDITIELALTSARIKSIHPIALGDCFAIGLAKQKNATAVTGDPEFKSVENEIDVLWLPTK